MKKAVFITGTDTGVGKTVVTGLLARFFLKKGSSIITQKWIGTGSRGFSADIQTHLKLMNKPKAYIKDHLEYVCPYTFKAACSPHLAAESEGKKISSNKIKKDFKLLNKVFNFVLVEGVGGVLVPFDKSHTVIDIVKDLHLPVLIVVGNKLGAINHTLLTVEALKKRKIDVLGMVFNNFPKQDQKILADNQRIIKSITKYEVFGALNRRTDHNKLHEDFIPIGEKIWQRIRS